MPDYTYERPDGVHWVVETDPETGDATHTRITPRAGKSAFMDREHVTSFVVKNEQPLATDYKPISLDGLSAEAQMLVGMLLANPVTSVEDGIRYLGTVWLKASPEDIRKAAERYCACLPQETLGAAPARRIQKMTAFLRGRRPNNLKMALDELAGAFSWLSSEQREAGAVAYFKEPDPRGVSQ